jgi:hypothetical protein
VARAREHGGFARWYLFGSASEDPSAAADVDVLEVCNSDADADAIRRLVDAIEFYRPLHLSTLTQDEEREIGLGDDKDVSTFIEARAVRKRRSRRGSRGGAA